MWVAVADLRTSQLTMARYLRNPETAPAPEGVEPRRLKIYQDLIYNNIEGFISSGFPVLRSLYGTPAWHALVRQFIDGHRCHSPYFLEISQEFLQFLLERHKPGPDDPPFITELAHYEWVELALMVSSGEIPKAVSSNVDPLTAIPRLSPLAWVLAYQFPVQMIGPDYQPAEPEAPVYLVVYRNRDDAVQFMALNAATARLLELTRENATIPGAELLGQLAAELGMDTAVVRQFGARQLTEFVDSSILTLS